MKLSASKDEDKMAQSTVMINGQTWGIRTSIDLNYWKMLIQGNIYIL